MKKTYSVLLSVCGLSVALSILSGCSSSTSQTPPSSVSESPVSATQNSTAQPSVPAASTGGLKIDINHAPIAELDRLELPGTKPSLSERIQGGRPYATPEELVSKKVISAEEYKLIQGLVIAGKGK